VRRKISLFAHRSKCLLRNYFLCAWENVLLLKAQKMWNYKNKCNILFFSQDIKIILFLLIWPKSRTRTKIDEMDFLKIRSATKKYFLFLVWAKNKAILCHNVRKSFFPPYVKKCIKFFCASATNVFYVFKMKKKSHCCSNEILFVQCRTTFFIFCLFFVLN
jgi:hypothetical protein